MKWISAQPQPPVGPQTLLLDADDTLWENNIYFERAIAGFISYLDHRDHSPQEVREQLNVIERRTIAASGYGTDSFRASLLQCFEQLSTTSGSVEQREQIMSFVDAIVASEIQLMDGVALALDSLSKRHRLILVTKGNIIEQRDKLDRSGLANYFAAVEILEEKTPEAYTAVGVRHGCVPATTWMVGNSPKSDINPALAAGFHTVFIPHTDTWSWNARN